MIKHYKDGEFHKDYDRSDTVNSMTNFLRDPMGDLPWEEDINAVDVYHLQDGDVSSLYNIKFGYLHSLRLGYFFCVGKRNVSWLLNNLQNKNCKKYLPKSNNAPYTNYIKSLL